MYNRARLPASRSRVKNRILSALTGDEYRSISRHLSFVELKQGEVLFSADNWIEYAYFMNSGMASSVSVTAEGQTVEDGIVGLEGLMGGLAAALLSLSAAGLAQGPGEAILYQESFNSGQAAGWQLEPGWQIAQDGDNAVLAGEGHHWARPGVSFGAISASSSASSSCAGASTWSTA